MGYPTFLLYTKDKKHDPILYLNEMSYIAMKDFIDSNLSEKYFKPLLK